MNNLGFNICQQCGKRLSGRIDKRFCDAYCRNAFNNKINRQDERLIMDINKIIRKNRRILKTLSPQGKAIVRRSVVESMGFNFDHFSGLHNTSKALYYMNYDYGFRALIDNGKQKIQIIQVQDYMDSFDPWKYLKK